MLELEDHYSVLGIGPAASAEEVRRAYRKLVLDYHPDRLQRLPKATLKIAEEQVKQINWAYEVLGNAERRRRYNSLWRTNYSLPKPLVDPASINWSDV